MYINIYYIYIQMTENKIYYTESIKKAIKKYRETHRDKYNKYENEYMKKKMEDPVFAEARREKMAEYSRSYYQKKREEKLASGHVPKPVGRPKKIVVEDLGELEN